MRTVMPPRPRRTIVALLAAAGSLLLLSVLAPPVAAHGDEGEMELTRFDQVGPDLVEVEVGIVYANDGHLAESATVSAQLTHDDGTVVGPVDLEHQGEGTSFYGTTVELPAAGSWSVTVTSTEPDASVDGALVVDDTPATTEAPTTEAPTTTATEPDPATDDTPVVSPPTDDLATAVEDDTGNFVLVLVAALVVVALVGGGVVWSRRNRGGAGDGPPPAGDT